MRYLDNESKHDDLNLDLIYPLEVTERLVLKYLPAWGRGADEDKIVVRLRKSDYLDAHYLSVQPNGYVRVAIVVDIDSDLDVDLMKSLGIPMPRTITGHHSCDLRRPMRLENPFKQCRIHLDTHDDRSARPHLIYWLDRPIFLKNKAQARKYDRVCKALKECLRTICKVDAINPVTTKNPAKSDWWSGDPAWHVIKGNDKLWTLDELDDAIRRAKVTYKPKPEKAVYSDSREKPAYQVSMARGFREEVAAEGRHNRLWETMKFFGYAHKAHASSEEDLFKYMLEQCLKFDALNNKDDPLPYSSIKSTAKSIARWTWRYYTGPQDDKDRGACKREGLIHAGMPKRQRQAVGGQYGAKKNADAKRDTVFKAIAELEAAGEPVVVSKLARDLGLSRPTVRKYVNLAAEETTSKVATARVLEAAPGVEKTVPIREGNTKDPLRPDRHAKPIEVEIQGDRMVLWPTIEDNGKLINRHGAVLERSYLEPYIVKPESQPEDIEIPSFLS